MYGYSDILFNTCKLRNYKNSLYSMWYKKEVEHICSFEMVFKCMSFHNIVCTVILRLWKDHRKCQKCGLKSYVVLKYRSIRIVKRCLIHN